MRAQENHSLTSAVVIALACAVTWVFLTQSLYDYNMGFGEILNLNIFPLLAWTGGLTLGYIIAEASIKKLKLAPYSLYRPAVVVILYAASVIILETIGYHLLGIQNIGTSQYSGIAFCDCLHAPLWMQAGYFALGPLHWLVVRTIIHLRQRSVDQASSQI